MLCDRCLSVSVLWPNVWMDQDKTWLGGKWVVVVVVVVVVVLDLVSLVLCQEVGWEKRLQNDLFC